MGEPLPVPDFAKVFDEAPAPFLLLTPDFVIVHANRARLEATATTLEDTVGRNLFDVFPMNPDDPAADGLRNLRASLEQVRDTGRPHTMAIQKYDIPMPDGTYVERFWSPRNVPILDDSGRVVLLLHRSDDITDYVRDRDDARLEAARGTRWRERVGQVEADLFSRTRELEAVNAQLRAAGERQRETSRRLAGLAALVSALAACESGPELLQQLFRLAPVPAGADALAVALPREDAAVDVLEHPHGGGTPLVPDPGQPLAAALAGRRILVPGAGGVPWPAPARAGQVRSWAALPLRAGGELLGALLLGWGSPRDLDDDDAELLDALAAQCAQAFERVRRLEEERRRAVATRGLAEVLQRSLLTEPPQPDHLEVAVRYLPAAQEASVGGDWYDAFLSADGATTLVIGDVTGHDRFAAAVMGQLRNLLRGVAHSSQAPPAEVLARLDRALADLGVDTLATAVLARVEQGPQQAAAGLRTLRWSNAGHLPPLLLDPDGGAHLLESSADLLLGLVPDAPRGDHEVVLHPGATVLLCTDGLVERRDEPLGAGLDRLAAAAAELAGLPLDELCDALIARLAPDPDDDVALVALRAHPEDRPRPAARR